MALYRMLRDGNWPVEENPSPGLEKRSGSKAASTAGAVFAGKKRAKKRSSANTAPESRDNDGTHRNIGMAKRRAKAENTKGVPWLRS
jgi:hypothetical protein